MLCVWVCGIRIHKVKRPATVSCGAFWNKSLTMTYFHRCPSTIIGAEVFHGPVRDGKAWDHLAMVVKRNLLPGLGGTALASLGQSGKKQRVVRGASHTMVSNFWGLSRWVALFCGAGAARVGADFQFV